MNLVCPRERLEEGLLRLKRSIEEYVREYSLYRIIGKKLG